MTEFLKGYGAGANDMEAGRLVTKSEVGKERDELKRALRRLVALKDGPRDENYERCKPLAWDQARLLSEKREAAETSALTAEEQDATRQALNYVIQRNYERDRSSPRDVSLQAMRRALAKLSPIANGENDG